MMLSIAKITYQRIWKPGGIIVTGDTQSTQGKMSQWHFSTTNHSQSGPGLKPLLCSEVPLPQPRQGSSLQYVLEIRLYIIA